MAVTHIPSLSSAIKATLSREFIVAGRNLSELANPWVFFVAVAIFIPLAISPDAKVLGLIAPGIVWIIALLAVLLSLEHIFQRDLENGCLEQMIISGQPMYWLVIAKTFAHWLFTGLPLTIFSPILAMMLSMPEQGYWVLVVSLFFGTGALSFLGAIGAAVTVALRRGGLLISLIIIPFYLPILIFGAAAVRNSIDGISVNSPVAVLAMFWLASILFAPLATAAALKVGLQE